MSQRIFLEIFPDIALRDGPKNSRARVIDCLAMPAFILLLIEMITLEGFKS